MKMSWSTMVLYFLHIAHLYCREHNVPVSDHPGPSEWTTSHMCFNTHLKQEPLKSCYFEDWMLHLASKLHFSNYVSVVVDTAVQDKNSSLQNSNRNTSGFKNVTEKMSAL